MEVKLVYNQLDVYGFNMRYDVKALVGKKSQFSLISCVCCTSRIEAEKSTLRHTLCLMDGRTD